MANNRSRHKPAEYNYTCGCGKPGYLSRKLAAQSAAQWRGKGVQPANKLRTYRCEHDTWHLTASQDAATRAAYKDAGLR